MRIVPQTAQRLHDIAKYAAGCLRTLCEYVIEYFIQIREGDRQEDGIILRHQFSPSTAYAPRQVKSPVPRRGAVARRTTAFRAGRASLHDVRMLQYSSPQGPLRRCV